MWISVDSYTRAVDKKAWQERSVFVYIRLWQDSNIIDIGNANNKGGT
jgi:hypothetical protein